MPIWTGTISTDWNTAGNWSIDGSGNTGVPTAATDAIFNSGSSNPCTTGTVTRNCRDLITTGYTGTLQIGSSTAGPLRVVRNITLGSQVGHITGLADIQLFAASGSMTLDVQSGVIIPNLNAAPNANFTLNVVLTRTTVATNFVKQGVSGSSTNFTSGGGSVELQITNMRPTSTGSIIFAANTALRFIGSATYDTFTFNGGSMILDTGATLTPATNAGNLGVTMNLNGTLNANFSAGTLIYPALSNTNRLGTYLSLGAGAMTLNFGSNTVDNVTITSLPNALSVVLQSDLVVNRTFAPGFGVLFTGGFNLIVKESLSRAVGTIRNNAGGKVIYQGTSTGFIGMGYISGTTFTITSIIQGNLSGNSIIHAPSVSSAANYILGVTTFNTTYTLSNSQTIGSVGSPVMFYGYGIGNLNIGEAAGSNLVLEIDAGSNDVYYVGNVGIYGTTSELRYLSTNTGIFDGSKGAITITSVFGVIDFQGQSSTTKFIGSLANNAFFSGCTLKSDLYVNTLTLLNGSGLSQIGSRTIYVSGNLTTNTGNGAGGGGPVVQPTIELIGTANSNFTCTALNANIRINKDPLAVVTVTQSFTYGTSIGSPYTFEYQNGIVNVGSTNIAVASNAIFNTVGMDWFNVTIPSGTHQLNSLLRITNNFTLASGGNVTFTGTAGWSCNNIICTTVGRIITLAAGITYNTLSSANLVGATGSRVSMVSSSSTARAAWTLAAGATQSIIYTNGTRIDSSAAQTVWSYAAGLSGTINWNPRGFVPTSGYTFVS
jgi:fibronectin-binding autotransporter adhesin